MTDPDSVVGQLSGAPIFAGLNDDSLAALARVCRPVSFVAGRMIFSRGDPGSDAFLVREGRVKISIVTGEGRELAFTHIERGGLFGEIAMLDGAERTADASALTAVEALRLRASDVRQMLHERPSIGDAIIRFLCRRLRETDLQVEGIALHRIEVRLARYFLSICRQIAPYAEGGAQISFELGMSQGELALLLGASRPKVNAALIELQDQGVITRQGTRVTCDTDLLDEIAEMA